MSENDETTDQAEGSYPVAEKFVETLRANATTTFTCRACEKEFNRVSGHEHKHAQGTVLLCSPCFDSAQKARVDREAAVRVERMATARSYVEDRIGLRYADATWEDLQKFFKIRKQAETLAQIEDAVRGGRSMIFCGPVGTGKTFAASQIVMASIAAGVDVEFVDVAELVDEIRASAHEHGTTIAIIERLRQRPLLILDDLAVERPTPIVLTDLCRILGWRWRDARQTIVSTNLNSAEIGKRYGNRILSRFIGLAAGPEDVIRFSGEDSRSDAVAKRLG